MTSSWFFLIHTVLLGCLAGQEFVNSGRALLVTVQGRQINVKMELELAITFRLNRCFSETFRAFIRIVVVIYFSQSVLLISQSYERPMSDCQIANNKELSQLIVSNGLRMINPKNLFF